MAMREGYKQTEVGVIPEDWDVSNLGEKTIKVGSGITPTGGEKVYKTEGRPFLRSQNIGWGYLILDDVAFINEETHSAFNSTEIEQEDVFLNITGASIGRSAVADDRVVGGNVNQHVCIIRNMKGQLYPRYLNYFLLSRQGQKQIDSFQAGGNRQGLNFGQIRSFLIALPPTLDEQTAIASVLSDTDALIQSLDRFIEKKRLIKQGAMQELLTGKKRLPGFSGEWKIWTLFDLAGRKKEQFDDGDWIEAEYLTDKGVRLIQTGNIGVGRFQDKETKKYISFNSFDTLRCKRVIPGDLLICRLAEPAGRACIMPDLGEEKVITAVDVTIFRPDLQLAESRFLLQVFCTSDWFQKISDQCGGSTRSRIARGALGKIEIKVPLPEEQTAIAAILSDMDAEIEALEEKQDKYKAIKQGMMQELLTGRIRIR